MLRKVKLTRLTLGVILSVVVLALAWGVAGSLFTVNTIVSPGDVVIDELSSAGADCVTLRNNTNNTIDLSGYIFTDGDHRFVFPNGSALPSMAVKRIASSRAQDKDLKNIDYYWGEWGISRAGELVLLLNNEGSLVIDFVFSPSLETGQILKRKPQGTGKLQLPNGTPVVQLQTASFRAVPIDVIKKVGDRFKALVIFLGSLLGVIVTLLNNYERVRDAVKRLLGATDSSSATRTGS